MSNMKRPSAAVLGILASTLHLVIAPPNRLKAFPQVGEYPPKVYRKERRELARANQNKKNRLLK